MEPQFAGRLSFEESRRERGHPNQRFIQQGAQAPKLAPYVQQMRERLAAACGVEPGQVSVKATTEEGLGFTGTGEGIAAHAVCLLEPLPLGDDSDPDEMV